jgi:hypothetical protein
MPYAVTLVLTRETLSAGDGENCSWHTFYESAGCVVALLNAHRMSSLDRRCNHFFIGHVVGVSGFNNGQSAVGINDRVAAVTPEESKEFFRVCGSYVEDPFSKYKGV